MRMHKKKILTVDTAAQRKRQFKILQSTVQGPRRTCLLFDALVELGRLLSLIPCGACLLLAMLLAG